MGNIKAFTADWTPDGSHIIYSYQHKIAIVNEDGSDPHTIAEIPGSAAWFRYSPDGRLIRFSILQDLENSSSLWEMRADGTNLHQLLPNWKESLDQCCGRWSPDGNYYYFLTSAFGGGGPSQGIWVMPEHRSIFRRASRTGAPDNRALALRRSHSQHGREEPLRGGGRAPRGAFQL